jgi:hypothetical protein
MIAGPEISRLVDEFTTTNGNIKRKKFQHHDETHATQKHFIDKVGKLVETLIELGNPFEEESTYLYALDTKDVMDAAL